MSMMEERQFMKLTEDGTEGETMKIDWTSLSQEDKKILASIGVKEPKKRKKKSTKKYTNLKDKGVPIQIQRNIFCCHSGIHYILCSKGTRFKG